MSLSNPAVPPPSSDEIARKLARLQREAVREVRASSARLARAEVRDPDSETRVRPRLTLRRLGWWTGWGLTVLVLPFATLVGGAAWAYRHGAPTWVALALAASLTAGILTAYGALTSRALTGKFRLVWVGKWIATPVVAGYLAFSLLYLSSINAKSDDVQAVYRTVHPMLRLAVATATLADEGLVVTDLARVPEDYDAMGLPRYENSLHFRQADGYVHAMDLRTIGRSELRNRLMILYFRALGFRTLRHVGTADHLHISLPLPS